MEINELDLLRAGRSDLSWLSENYAQILKSYDNQFVAVKDKEVIAASKNMDALLRELKRKKIDPATTLVQFVTSAAVIL